MLFTDCPTCDRQLIVAHIRGRTNVFVPHDCEHCGETMVIESKHRNATAYDEAYFVDNILPNLDIERVDSPDHEDYIYGNPERFGSN